MLSTEFDNGFGGASSSFSFAAQRLEQSFEIADVDPGRDMRGFNARATASSINSCPPPKLPSSQFVWARKAVAPAPVS